MSQNDLDDLRQGVIRFQSLVFPRQRPLYEELGDGQSPKFLFIACSDSRVDPQTYTQSRPGELFLFRNAGNLVQPFGGPASGDAATIEYAVKVLKVRHIIVSGHSDCGAMKALLNPESLENLPAVRDWLKYAEAVRQVAQTHWADLSPEERLRNVTQYNTLVQVNHIRTHPSVSAALQQKELQIHGSYYDVRTGEVYGYDVAAGEWFSIVDRIGGKGVDSAIS